MMETYKKILEWTWQPTWVNKSNIWPRTWNWDDPINRIAKKNTNKKNIFKKCFRKWPKSTWANLLDLWFGSWDRGDLAERKPEKTKKKILNQTNIERWNWGQKINKKLKKKTN